MKVGVGFVIPFDLGSQSLGAVEISLEMAEDCRNVFVPHASSSCEIASKSIDKIGVNDDLSVGTNLSYSAVNKLMGNVIVFD